MNLQRTFVLRDAPYARQAIAFVTGQWQAQARAGRPLVLTVTEQRPTRTLGQNARMWAMLAEVSRQVDWYGRRLAPEEWKDVFTAALKRQQVVPGLDGGFVVLGASSRELTVDEMSELIELVQAFGAERGVRFGQDRRTPADGTDTGAQAPVVAGASG